MDKKTQLLNAVLLYFEINQGHTTMAEVTTWKMLTGTNEITSLALTSIIKEHLINPESEPERVEACGMRHDLKSAFENLMEQGVIAASCLPYAITALRAILTAMANKKERNKSVTIATQRTLVMVKFLYYFLRSTTFEASTGMKHYEMPSDDEPSNYTFPVELPEKLRNDLRALVADPDSSAILQEWIVGNNSHDDLPGVSNG